MNKICWMFIEALITSLATALVGSLAALWFYRRRVERRYKLDAIIKFKDGLGKTLNEAVVIFNHSKPVMGALRRLWLFRKAGFGGGPVDMLLKEVVEAMYDDVKITYDTFPVLDRFQLDKDQKA